MEEGLVIRASSLNKVHDCARRAIAECVPTHLKENFGLAPVQGVGRAITELLGNAFHSHAETGSREWRELLKTEGVYVLYDATTPDVSIAYKQLNRMADIFNEYFPDWRQNSLLEKPMELEIKKGVKLTGHPDRISESGILMDLKTGRKRISVYHAQLGAYMMLAKNDEVYVKTSQVIHVGRSVDYIEVEEYNPKQCLRRAREACSILVEALEKLNIFGKEHSLRNIHTNPSSSLCSDNWCGAYGRSFCPITMNKLEVLK